MKMESTPTPQNHETPKVPEVPDREYSSAVSRHFNASINYSKNKRVEGESEDPEELEYQQFLTEQKQALSKIASPKELETLALYEVSFAIASLCHTMAAYNPDFQFEGAELVGVDGKYDEARKLFMDSCKKMFPDIEVAPSPADIQIQMRKIEKVNLFNLDDKDAGVNNPFVDLEKFGITQTLELLKTNPQEVIKRIDDVLQGISSRMNGVAYGTFESENAGEIDYEIVLSRQKRLASLIEPIYKLERIKDAIKEKFVSSV